MLVLSRVEVKMKDQNLNPEKTKNNALIDEQQTIQKITDQEYKYGFVSDIEMPDLRINTFVFYH